MQLVGIQIYNLDTARIKNQRNEKQITITRMRIACWLPKATNTHSEYVILVAFPQQQWLHERSHCYVIRTLSVWLDSSYSPVQEAYIFFNAKPKLQQRPPKSYFQFFIILTNAYCSRGGQYLDTVRRLALNKKKNSKRCAEKKCLHH